MSRLVEPVPSSGQLFAGDDPGEKAREYGERLSKYVPAEIIAAYLTLLPLVTLGSDPDTDRRTILLAVIFALGVVFTPLYLWRFPAQKKVKIYHLVISTLAFVVWSYSIQGGLFDDLGIYDEVVAPILLVVFTLASGLFVPSEGTEPPPPDPQPQPPPG